MNLIEKIKKHYVILLLFILILFHTINNYIWLTIDTQPPAWGDQNRYLQLSIFVYKAIITFSVDQFMHFTYRPPLVYVLVSAAYFIAGTSPDVAIFTNVLYFAILIFSVYGISKKISGKEEIGLLSAFIISTFPMIFGMSRQFLMDFPLTAMVSLSIYFLIQTEHFENKKYSILFGVSIAFGMFVKQTYPIFILTPFIYIIHNDIRRLFHQQRNSELKRRKSIQNIILAVIIAIGIASVWYIPNMKTILLFYSINTGGTASVFSLQSILFYPIGMINYQISFFYFFLFVLLIFWTLSYRNFKNSMEYLRSYELIVLILWISIPVLIFTFHFTFPNKEFRYVLPSLPPIAIAISLMIDKIVNKKYKMLMIFCIILFSLLQYFAMSYGTEALPDEIYLNTNSWLQKPIDKVVLFSQSPRWEYPGLWEESWTYPARNEDWKIEDIIDLISETTLKDNPQVDFIPKLERFMPAHFYYHLIRTRENMKLYQSNYSQFKEVYLNYDYIIVKDSNNCGVTRDCDDINRTFNFFINNSNNFSMIKKISLPDGSNALIYFQKNTTLIGGWYGLEYWDNIPSRWISNNATILVDSPKSGISNMSLKVTSFYQPRIIHIYLNDKLIHEQQISTGFIEINKSIDLNNGTNKIKFYTPDGCQNPIDIPGKKFYSDNRCLSLAFQNISLDDNYDIRKSRTLIKE